MANLVMDQKDAWERVKSTTCICGGPKQKLLSICRSCWHRLPRSLALELWRPFSDGFLIHYRTALQWLLEHNDGNQS